MNKLKFLLFPILLWSFTSYAQSDKKAQDILKSVSAKYKSLSSIKAEFSILIESPQNKNNDKQTGTLYLKGNKYKLEIAGQEVITDSKTVWSYMKESNEVRITEPNAKEDDLSPNNIFTIYEKGFSYKFNEERKEKGKDVILIDLMPTDKSKKYFKIRLSINKTEKLIVSALIFEKNGNHITYSIDKLSPDFLMNDAMFTFNKVDHPKVEVVDLR